MQKKDSSNKKVNQVSYKSVDTLTITHSVHSVCVNYEKILCKTDVSGGKREKNVYVIYILMNFG